MSNVVSTECPHCSADVEFGVDFEPGDYGHDGFWFVSEVPSKCTAGCDLEHDDIERLALIADRYAEDYDRSAW
jgi:hypothetical protein